MSWWSRFLDLFRPPVLLERGLMVRDGRELRWRVNELPIDVVVHPNAIGYLGEIASAARGWNLVREGTFLYPAQCTSMMLAVFELGGDPLKRLRRTVLVRVDGDASVIQGTHFAHTEHRYDTRDGTILNATVTLPPRHRAIAVIGQQLAYQAVTHELGHVLGLDHDDQGQSIMSPQLSIAATVVSQSDVALIRRAYPVS